MFTGIVEHIGQVTTIVHEGSNIHFDLKVPFEEAIKVDQSIAHNGVCLTVTDVFDQMQGNGSHYRVTAIQETLNKTNLGDWEVGSMVNIERCMQIGARLDGHFVQGHVDARAKVLDIQEEDGSWRFRFEYPKEFRHLVVPKGSITVNGVSLTVVDCPDNFFSVAIIPFTYSHTNFQQLEVGHEVNIEFDILGKYMVRYREVFSSQAN